jgi:PAS domain-containing protein
MTPEMPLVTQFASPERASEGEVARQVRLLAEVEYLPQFTNITSNFVAVMNPERQIVYANRPLIDFAGETAQSVYGKRLGEFLGCIHSDEVCGCGTTEYCSVCGMTQAVLETRENRSSRKDWRVIQKTGDFLEFRVQAEPLKMHHSDFSRCPARKPDQRPDIAASCRGKHD